MPTPFTHASANDGRSFRRAVDPMKTMRTAAVVEEDDGAWSLSQPRATPISSEITATAMLRRSITFLSARVVAALHVRIPRPERRNCARIGVVLVPPYARCVVGEEMNGHGGCVRDRFHVVDVAVRRQQRIELSRLHRLLRSHSQNGFVLLAAIVKPRVGRVELRAAIDADETPRQMIVHRG